jgi:hypothetical protein
VSWHSPQKNARIPPKTEVPRAPRSGKSHHLLTILTLNRSTDFSNKIAEKRSNTVHIRRFCGDETQMPAIYCKICAAFSLKTIGIPAGRQLERGAFRRESWITGMAIHRAIASRELATRFGMLLFLKLAGSWDMHEITSGIRR